MKICANSFNHKVPFHRQKLLKKKKIIVNAGCLRTLSTSLEGRQKEYRQKLLVELETKILIHFFSHKYRLSYSKRTTTIFVLNLTPIKILLRNFQQSYMILSKITYQEKCQNLDNFLISDVHLESSHYERSNIFFFSINVFRSKLTNN